MLTITQATAILSILLAFGVDLGTVNKVHDILIPPEKNVPVVVVPVVQTPIIQSAPVYIGSIEPTPPPVTPPTPPAPPVIPPVVVPVDDIALVTQTEIDYRSARHAPSDVEAPEGWFLRVSARETIDFLNSTFSTNIKMEKVVHDDKRDCENCHYYEALLSGVETYKDITVTIRDFAGNTKVRNLYLYPENN